MKTPVTREVAATINPLINSFCQTDTLQSCASVVTDLGYMLYSLNHLADGHEAELGEIYLFCNVIAAALKFEAEAA